MNAHDTVRTDVLIVGSGAAGVTAAIEAREAGADVVVLEREDHFGGAAAISGGGCFLVDTPLQRQNGIKDSNELALDDWIRFGQGEADEEWARFYVEHTLHDLYEWAENRGVRWMRLIQQEGNSVPRWHQPERGGAGMWLALHDYAVSRGANDWRLSTPVRELIMDEGRAVGVRAENLETGESLEFRAKAVVMASGGFASNIDMVYKYRPDLRKYGLLEGSHIGATGDGHRMVESVGGVLTHMNELWTYVHAIPDHQNPKRGYVIRLLPASMSVLSEPMWVWVNMQGRRFHNETLYNCNTGTPALLAQEPAECWAIIDGTMFGGLYVGAKKFYQEGSTYPDLDEIQRLIEESPHIKSSDTLADLGSQMGVPVEPMTETIARYNAEIDQGLEYDSAFGRPLKGLRKIERPPFYAFHFVPLARKTLGGTKTDLRCQALDSRGEPIPGLYAAGELAGMAGGHINGKACLEGTMLGPSLFSGRVAGAWAAHDAGFGKGFVHKPLS